ncbi:redoxin family protein [Muricoccus nepalensis]|uniref:redoxin family protein n=1 Tax=Muricoccus nepalensis TaxID=1854500 RepID=UPI001386D9B9|nr:redoxin domain-containing protein [Roseomonas nepalensis]
MPGRRLLAPGLLAGLVPALAPSPARSFAPQAPDFVGIDGWINAPAPLSVAGLRGKVALVDFWTYSCINCRRTVPYLNRWQAEYGPRGLQVVGIHTPEFGFERMRRNVEAAVREFGILYPVGQDNDRRTWRAWSNQAWPAFYLLDREGRVVLLREGEGHAREMEGAIRGLLGLSGPFPARPGEDPDLSHVRSPEVYFGALHPTPQERAQSPRRGEATYAFAGAGPGLNRYDLDGTWARGEEELVLRSARGGLRMRFSAARLHLVAGVAEGMAEGIPLRVRADGGAWRVVEVGRPTLYTLLDGETYGEHLVEVEAPAPGLSLFSATFG